MLFGKALENVLLAHIVTHSSNEFTHANCGHVLVFFKKSYYSVIIKKASLLTWNKRRLIVANSYWHRTNDLLLRENDWTTENLTNNKGLLWLSQQRDRNTLMTLRVFIPNNRELKNHDEVHDDDVC